MKRKTRIRLMTVLLMLSLLIPAAMPSPQAVQAAGAELTLNQSEVNIKTGKKVTLKVIANKQVRKIKSIKWSISKKKVATISKKGKVTGKKAGTATVTAKVSYLKKGSKKTLSKTLKATVRVSAKAATPAKPDHQNTTDTNTPTSDKDNTIDPDEGKEPEEHTHKYVEVTIPATCTTAGKTTYTCTCGDAYDKEIPATGHTSSDWTIKTIADCTHTGLNEKICIVCKEILESETIARTDHVWGAPVVTAEATCAEPGTSEITCAVCQEKKQEEIPVKAHTYQVTVVEATQSSGGYTLHHCTVCDYEYRDQETFYVPSEAEVHSILIGLQSAYPEGTHWTNEDNRYETIFHMYDEAMNYLHSTKYTGRGCAAFVAILSDKAFGSLPVIEHRDASRIRVGDMLRIDGDTHAVIVLEVKSGSVIVAEGNYNSSVHWGREIPFDKLALDYVWTRYPSGPYTPVRY